MASREEQEYSSQAPAGYIGDLLSQTIFPYATQYFRDQFQNLGTEDSSPFTYTGQRVADFDPRERLAMQLSDSAIGSYRPYLGASADVLGQAADITRGSVGEFDPANIKRFYDPFEDAVVQQTLDDIDRRYATSDKALRDRAVSQGAFGGSRGRIAQQELAAETGRGAAEAIGKIRSGGFGQAAGLASNAFEQAQRRGLSGAGQLGQLGQQYSGLASALPALQGQDISRTMGLGGLGRGRSQSLMDLAYQNFTGQYNLPMQLVQNLGSLTASLGPLAGGYGYAGGAAPTSGTYTPNTYSTPYTGIQNMSIPFAQTPYTPPTGTPPTGTPPAGAPAAGIGSFSSYPFSGGFTGVPSFGGIGGLNYNFMQV